MAASMEKVSYINTGKDYITKTTSSLRKEALKELEN